MQHDESDIKKMLNSVKFGTILTEEHIITILYNSLCSFQFLHSANIMHRNIKPDNLLINSKCEITITDFGLSRPFLEPDGQSCVFSIKQDLRSKMLDYSKNDTAKDQQAYRSRMSKKLKISRDKEKKRTLSEHMCSRWYRAPEIILLEKKYDHGIDIWAVGCILEEMIKCSQPYVKGMPA